MSRKRLLLPIASLVCCLCFVAFSIANEDHASPGHLDELHSEKLSLLEDMVSRYEFGYAKGRPVLEELLAAKRDVLFAKLSTTDTHADRVKLRELIVENRGQLVEARIAGHRLGNNAEVEILAARVEHIDAKIALQHEQSGRQMTR